jgi:hypothetical protein
MSHGSTACQTSGTAEDRVKQSGREGAFERHVAVDNHAALLIDAHLFVCAQIGTTSSTAVDPVKQLGVIARVSSSLTSARLLNKLKSDRIHDAQLLGVTLCFRVRADLSMPGLQSPSSPVLQCERSRSALPDSFPSLAQPLHGV